MSRDLSINTSIASQENWPIKFIALIGGIFPGLAIIGVAAVLPQIEAELARTATDRMLVKLLGPIIGVSMVVGAPLTGFFADRMNPRLIFVVATVVYAVAGTCGFYVSNLGVLLTSRLLLGLAAAAIVTVSMTLINTRFEGIERAKWMGYNVSAAISATLILHPLIGILGEMGWHWPFAVYLLGLMAAGVVQCGPREHASQRHVRRATWVSQQQGNDAPLFKWFPLRYVPLAIIIGSITYLPTVYLPFAARNFGVVSPAAISFIMLADSIIGASMSYFFGQSQRVFSSRATFVFSFSCTGSGMLVVVLTGSLWGLIAGMLIFGFGMGWFTANLLTSVSRNVEQGQQGRAVGIVKAAHFISAPLAVLAVEPVTRAAGPVGAFWVVGILSIGAVLMFLFQMSFGPKGRAKLSDLAV